MRTAENQSILLDPLQLEMLADILYTRIEKRLSAYQDKWLDLSQVKALLRVSSSSTIQDLRDSGQLRFSKINSRTILYDRDSVLEYIERHIKEKF